jgi:methionyl-tRNA synthetase
MPERIFVGVAWPYPNGPLHLGQIAGAMLPADIFARYHRLKGNQVLMVSGTDQHGTPVAIRAEQEGLTPQQIVDRYHAQYLDSWRRLGISYDLYTTTGTEDHRAVVQDLFLALYKQGLIYPSSSPHPYCERDRRFLPDRYVEGTCPHCGNPRARGDQCEPCGRPLNPQELLNWRCRTCGQPPVLRESEHFFLRLSAFQEPLMAWVRGAQGRWRANVYSFTMSWLAQGLLDRAITRDIAWGVPIPLPGYETKRIYVWFEAVTGYLSAAQEWAQRQGDPQAWRAFWQDPACKSYYFLGKDNIAFHTIIWPAMLMGYGAYDSAAGRGAYNLPYDVPANEFLSLEGRKFSTSQNWAVWLHDYLDRYAPDPLRYYLSANMPESADADFSWREFLRRNNDELVATYGNLVHRVLTFTYRNFQGRVPQPGPLDGVDTALLRRAERAMGEVDQSLAACRFREAIGHAMALAGEANRYIDTKAPWRTLKADPMACATALWAALQVISALKTAFSPFLPFSSARLHRLLGLPGEPQEAGWQAQSVDPGRTLGEPIPLFTKLEEERVLEEETQRLQAQQILACEADPCPRKNPPSLSTPSSRPTWPRSKSGCGVWRRSRSPSWAPSWPTFFTPRASECAPPSPSWPPACIPVPPRPPLSWARP